MRWAEHAARMETMRSVCTLVDTSYLKKSWIDYFKYRNELPSFFKRMTISYQMKDYYLEMDSTPNCRAYI
jgi:hypothetical protein